MKYSALVYPQIQGDEPYTRPVLPDGYQRLVFSSVSWDLTSSDDLDRTEYWENENGEYTYDQALDLSRKNTPPQYNKRIALQLLSDTDWSVMPDVSDMTISSPYLMNKQDFISYRNEVRKIAVNPPKGLAVFPTAPQPQWSSI